MNRDRRQGEERRREDSDLQIQGRDSQGGAFSESTKTNDISDTGVSFYLATPIWTDSHLTIRIRNSSLMGSQFQTHAKVVRVRSDSAGRQFVAARFD